MSSNKVFPRCHVKLHPTGMRCLQDYWTASPIIGRSEAETGHAIMLLTDLTHGNGKEAAHSEAACIILGSKALQLQDAKCRQAHGRTHGKALGPLKLCCVAWHKAIHCVAGTFTCDKKEGHSMNDILVSVSWPAPLEYSAAAAHASVYRTAWCPAGCV